ncbi:hypothetical protein ACWCYY_19495 [Kitasatospora sp. NPDC001664]
MSGDELGRLLVSLAHRAGLASGFAIGVRRIADLDVPARVPELERGFRVSERRRREFTAGRAAAAEGLARLGGPRRTVARSARGVPVWPSGSVGSISHTKAWAVALVADSAFARRCGVDIEEAAAADTSAQRLCAREAAYKTLSPGTGLPFRPDDWPLLEAGPATDSWTVGVPGPFRTGDPALDVVTGWVSGVHAALTVTLRPDPGPPLKHEDGLHKA